MGDCGERLEAYKREVVRDIGGSDWAYKRNSFN